MCKDRAREDLGWFPRAPEVVCRLIVRSETGNIFEFQRTRELGQDSPGLTKSVLHNVISCTADPKLRSGVRSCS